MSPPKTNQDQPWSTFRYASGVDVEFVRKSVRSIGRVAVKLERACERAMNVLLDPWLFGDIEWDIVGI